MSEVKSPGKMKLYLFLQLVLGILVVVGIVTTVAIIITGKTNKPFNNILDLIIYVLIIFYFLFGYKKPHSNILKYVMIIFVIISSFIGLSLYDTSKVQAYTLITMSVVLSYVCGRLNKFNKNRWILLVLFVLLLFSCIYTVRNVDQTIFATMSNLEVALYKWTYFNTIIQFTTLSIAYITRCYKHLKSGVVADEEEI